MQKYFLEEEIKSGKYKDGTQKYSYQCKDCKKIYFDNYYKTNKLNNKEKRSSYRNDKRKNLRNFISDYKIKNGCSYCGYNKNPNAIDFHHKENKKENISRMITNCNSKESIFKEIEKCILLCSNCHRENHSE